MNEDEGPNALDIALVRRQLELEVAKLEERLSLLDNSLIPAAEEQQVETERTAQNSDEDTDHRAYELSQERLLELISESTNTSIKLKTLRSPSELERRVMTRSRNQQSLRRLTMSEATAETTKVKKPNASDKGAPAIYLNDDGKFRIGMDARLKSDLVNSAVGAITTEKPGQSLQVFDPAEAEKLLTAFGWTPFLDRKKEILATAATKKADAQTKRDEVAREKAAAKATSDAEKAAAKAAGDESKPASGSKTDQLRQQREAAAAAAAK